MEQKGSTRRLSAILIADVAGYSRLMGQDEGGTVRRLSEFRQIFAEQIAHAHGRIVNAPGDSILAEFSSVVDAVACAVDIQRELAEKNAQLPEPRRMRFRIGLNLGDVILQGEEIYGDGVNIAARLQALAEPGGICVSGSVYDSVQGRLELAFQFQGEQAVKNIKQPVRTYQVVSKPGGAVRRVLSLRKGLARRWRKAALAAAVAIVLAGAGALAAWYFAGRVAPDQSVDEGGLPLPDKPSIAVLPFVNMSGDPEQEYFSDGITEDIITSLSKLRGLLVIARNSSFAYKNKDVDVRQIGRELGVRHILEGSVRKMGGRIRITAQLVDTTIGDHIWAESYDRELVDIFAIQDEITRIIVSELDVQLVEGESARIWRKETDNLEAYDYFLRAREVQASFSPRDVARARQLAEKALDLDPGFAAAAFIVGMTHYNDAESGRSGDLKDSFEKSRMWFQRAVDLDDPLGMAYSMLGAISISYDLDHEKAIEYGRRGITVDPNGSFEHAILSIYLSYSGQAEEGLEIAKKAFQINPLPQPFFYHPMGSAYLFLGRYEEAITTLEKCIQLIPDYMWCNINLTVAYMMAGQQVKSQAQAKNVLRINPNFTTDSFHVRRIKNPEVRAQFAAALRHAGLE